MTNLSTVLSIKHTGRMLCFLITTGLTLTNCEDKCRVEKKYMYYEPVYTTQDEIRAAVAQFPPAEITSPGKIYMLGEFIFVNEPDKGIHIIDNHNPAQPAPLSFLNVPGNRDLAVRGTTLFADSYVDLVAFDISDINHIREVERIEGLFNNLQWMGFSYDNQRGVVTSFVAREEITKYEDECAMNFNPYYGYYYMADGIAMAMASPADAAFAPTPAADGKGGSTARFTLSDNHLYALNGGLLETIDVTIPNNLAVVNETEVGWDAETLFPSGTHLFVGANSGMYIMNIVDPSTPVMQSKYDHLQSCDPVVVEGELAYVTLRSGTTCQGFTNQLEVIDLSDISAPALLAVYPMTNPYGLGIDGGKLFVCDGASGLKIFDAQDVYHVSDHLLAQYDDIQATDVIPFHNLALVIGAAGIYQYDYSDVSSIKLLSTLPIGGQ